jgi:hypothetical protein
MSSISTTATFGDLADSLTARTLAADPAKPPAVAAASPIHEILVRELAHGLPPELREKVEAEPSLNRVMDWLAVAALYRWVQNDAVARRAFVSAASTNPTDAGLALARAISARMEPPPRGAEWHRCDGLGLFNEIFFASAVLCGRATLFSALAWFAGLWVSPSAPVLLRGLFGVGVVFGMPPANFYHVANAALASGWFLAEAFWVPRIMERIRQSPAQQRGIAPPRSWRLDTFHAIWAGQALLFGFMSLGRLSIGVFTGEGSGLKITSAVLGVLLSAIFGLILRQHLKRRSWLRTEGG